ncbi:DUF6069 family protein [Nocardioides caricicola]|uniref:DUF6069 family protein n=1 Tax=Nocardioides caricicola TaxID=634770 RepID=A0ABW0N1V8_9ACTN
MATLAATASTTLAAALAHALGIDLEVSGGEAIPVPGIATVTCFLSLVGVGIALALRRWSDRPAKRFVSVAGTLTVLSLVPPLLLAGDAATAVTLVALHLLAAAVMVPALARGLR